MVVRGQWWLVFQINNEMFQEYGFNNNSEKELLLFSIFIFLLMFLLS